MSSGEDMVWSNIVTVVYPVYGVGIWVIWKKVDMERAEEFPGKHETIAGLRSRVDLLDDRCIDYAVQPNSNLNKSLVLRMSAVK